MFCTKCGTELRDQDRFCCQCGRSSGRGIPVGERADRLSRPTREGKLGGVCAGFARYLGVDVVLVRILWIVLVIWPLPLFGVISYIVAWVVMPKDAVAVPAQQMHPANGGA
jgi:phage shock protein PspC (stress-responsive transcriptional regulator)